MNTHLILLAEDDPLQRRLVTRMLESALPIEVIETGDGVEALQRLRKEGSHISLALLDLRMPGMDGMELLRTLRKEGSTVPCLVLTGSDRLEDAVEAMQLGALDFIPKPPQAERLVTSVRNALALGELKEEVDRLQQNQSPYYNFDDLLEISPALKETVELARKASAGEIPVLITGESGVGKELIARAIHRESPRRNRPFVAVNCGALPDNLVESTLFGHEKGSFTGASARSIGKCREADGGVLFLDEVGELKPETQVKLLRMLQQGEIEPVGSSKSVQVDVRVISATNRDLEKLVEQGKFREDLYYRLQGLPVHVPPLRERRNDIASLSRHLLKSIATREQRAPIGLSKEAIDWLKHYDWPGNVRELQHRLHRASLLCEKDTLSFADVANWALPSRQQTTAPVSGNMVALDDASGQPKTLDEIELEIIEATLARFDNHVGRAAAALGIGQSTLYKRVRKQAS
jgi:DNA-binding NtrC family response regulator